MPMKASAFLEIVEAQAKKFDTKGGESTVRQNKSTLENDINRTPFSFASIEAQSMEQKIHRNLIFKIFEHFSVEYLQGMTEIASVLTVAYFQGEIKTLGSRMEDEEDEDSNPGFHFRNPNNTKLFEEFCTKNGKRIATMKKSLHFLLANKLKELYENNFAKYYENNKIFLKIMKSKGIHIEKDQSMKYMNYVLTFFTRLSGSEEVAFSFFSVIANSDVSVLFTLLIMFFDKIKDSEMCCSNDDEGKLIHKLNADFCEEVVKEHAYFLKVKENPSLAKNCKGCYLLCGLGIAAVAVGCAFFFRNKN
ncbi:hypothetical protein ENBRE01_2712 [Enteropsectra breve]|nr:hypothetical protein ENBRE01_2712 [Enteropsectra breve]